MRDIVYLFRNTLGSLSLTTNKNREAESPRRGKLLLFTRNMYLGGRVECESWQSRFYVSTKGLAGVFLRIRKL